MTNSRPFQETQINKIVLGSMANFLLVSILCVYYFFSYLCGIGAIQQVPILSQTVIILNKIMYCAVFQYTFFFIGTTGISTLTNILQNGFKFFSPTYRLPRPAQEPRTLFISLLLNI